LLLLFLLLAAEDDEQKDFCRYFYYFKTSITKHVIYVFNTIFYLPGFSKSLDHPCKSSKFL